jgi:hypothetical protein
MALLPIALREPMSVGLGALKFRVVNTDPDWIEVLRSYNITDNINFWRKEKRRVHLPERSRFYFKLRGSRFIAGRAVSQRQISMSIREAWEYFSIRNGVSTYEELRRKATDILEVSDDTLNCLVLDEVEVLDPEEYPQLPPDFVATQNPKDYLEGSLPQIESSFFGASTLGLSGIEAQLTKDRVFDPDTVLAAREATLRAVVMRRGRSDFRQMLMDAYDHKCAVTGTEVRAILEAAHVYPYKGTETNVLQNGILLRSDWHTLFDLGLWAIDDDYRIIIAPEIIPEEYRKYHQTLIRLPRIVLHRPSPKAIRWHRNNVFCHVKIR